jgi:hypothetical protein
VLSNLRLEHAPAGAIHHRLMGKVREQRDTRSAFYTFFTLNPSLLFSDFFSFALVASYALFALPLSLSGGYINEGECVQLAKSSRLAGDQAAQICGHLGNRN